VIPVRTIRGLTITLLTPAAIWSCATALTARAQATDEPYANADLATPSAALHEVGGSPANSTMPDIFSQDANERANPLWAIPLASLTATLERPIFLPTRRPPMVRRPVTAQPVIVQPDRLTLTLVGAISGENAIAIFRDESTKGIVRLRIGQSHSGWSLERVTQRDATLRRNGEIATLALPRPTAK
jgi:hypothetical protein